jgi:hypothetical protein
MNKTHVQRRPNKQASRATKVLLLDNFFKEDNTIERYHIVRDRIKRLDDTKLMNDLPEFLYSNYSK